LQQLLRGSQRVVVKEMYNFPNDLQGGVLHQVPGIEQRVKRSHSVRTAIFEVANPLTEWRKA
jgi:hypothetical protein